MAHGSKTSRARRYAAAMGTPLPLPLGKRIRRVEAVMALADEEIEQAEVRVDAWQEMAELFRKGLWDVWVALGHDTDGDTSPMPLIAGMGEEGFVRMVLQDATKWRQESEDDYDADTARLEAEIDRLRVEVTQLQADLAESEAEVRRQYHEAQIAESKVARVEALAKWLRDAGWVNIYETSEELAGAVEDALSGAKCGASCPPDCHAQHAPRFNSRRSAGE